MATEYRRDIDGLRAIAVVSVVLFHTNLRIFEGGFIGVDIFFVISGYLITKILLNELTKKGNISYLNFYERRIRRILPALFIVLIVCCAFGWLTLIPYEYDLFLRTLISVIFFLSNTRLGQENNYFDPVNHTKPLTHTWSLGVEEQFYILFPIILAFVWHKKREYLLPILIMISICSLLGAQIGSAFKPGENFYFTLTRVWELLLGSVSALVSEKFRSNKILTDFGFLLICIGFFSFGPTTPTPSVFILLPTIGCALIIIFKSKKSITHKILEYKYMVFIGLLSYSLYLWHYPLFSFFQIMKGGVPSIIELTFLLILSFGLSYLSWKYIEQPFRKLNNLISKSRTHVFLSSTVLSFLILSFALIGRLDNGYEVRLPIDQRSDAIFQQEDIFRFVRTTGNDSCTKYLDLDLLFEEVCISNSKEPKMLIAGDSKAMSLYAPIYSNQFKVDAILIAAHGCPLYPNLSYVPTFETGFSNNCTEIAKKVIDIATNLSSIETIILFNEADNLNGDLSKYYLNGQKLNKVEAFNHAYSFVLSKLNKTGKKIIVVSDNPSWSVDPKKCIQKLPLSKAPADSCRINVEVFKEGLAGYFQELEELKKTYPNVVNYDPTRVLCDKNGSCDIREDNKLLYFDQTHMSPFAALKVLNAISNDGYLQY